MRFYIGQPVIAIFEQAKWLIGMPPEWEIEVPIKGNKYHISRCIMFDKPYVQVAEIGPPASNLNAWFCETGFAPITKDQVEEILKQACPVNSELEDA